MECLRLRVQDVDFGRNEILVESLLQKAVKDVVARAGLTKRATCHTFRHSFATQHSDFSAIKLETTPYSQESYMVLEAIIGGLYGST